MADQQQQLPAEVLARWERCDRTEAIRQCEIQYAEREKWMTLFHQMRDERDAAIERAQRAQRMIEGWVAQLNAMWRKA